MCVCVWMYICIYVSVCVCVCLCVHVYCYVSLPSWDDGAEIGHYFDSILNLNTFLYESVDIWLKDSGGLFDVVYNLSKTSIEIKVQQFPLPVNMFMRMIDFAIAD